MRRCRPILGTFVEVTAPDEDSIEVAFDVINSIHGLMSAHDAQSDIGRINRIACAEPVRVDRRTAAVIRRALHWSKLSGGAFDIMRAGRLAIESGEIPRRSDQNTADAGADWRDIVLGSDQVCLQRPGAIDVGGIAKGFAVDQAIIAMQRNGADWGLVNAGGDLRGFGDREWDVTVTHPSNRTPSVEIPIRNRAIATTAGRRRGEGSLDFGHLPDRSSNWVSVTVEADNAADADALTKVVMADASSAGPCLGSIGARALGLRPDGEVEEIRVPVVA